MGRGAKKEKGNQWGVMLGEGRWEMGDKSSGRTTNERGRATYSWGTVQRHRYGDNQFVTALLVPGTTPTTVSGAKRKVILKNSVRKGFFFLLCVCVFPELLPSFIPLLFSLFPLLMLLLFFVLFCFPYISVLGRGGIGNRCRFHATLCTECTDREKIKQKEKLGYQQFRFFAAVAVLREPIAGMKDGML
eukprot:Hpha_TRINITY_DN16197_c3_g3::TRINITY_DN16197_c3_g3_i1::g.5432::m.5432